mgnify:CR=1 FL=1
MSLPDKKVICEKIVNIAASSGSYIEAVVHVAEEDTKFGFSGDELRALANAATWEAYVEAGATVQGATGEGASASAKATCRWRYPGTLPARSPRSTISRMSPAWASAARHWRRSARYRASS